MDKVLGGKKRRYGERKGTETAVLPERDPKLHRGCRGNHGCLGFHLALQSSGRPGRGRQGPGEAQKTVPIRGRSLGDVGKRAPATETHPKEKSSSRCWKPSACCLQGLGEETPPGLERTGARASDCEPGELVAWIAELPRHPRRSGVTRIPLCPACCTPVQSVLKCPPAPQGPRAALSPSRKKGTPQGRDSSDWCPSTFWPFR
ncbi:uncharacterized protein LOC119038579 [Artibeus jamaicensis]|uniref:uncharacterized protein LOC119038579 n=1 Tax=Artibeus jamaicensis TaxID=9417 RepID=UPI00235A7A3F|nr:uncharacterized protein LOC119038579 [Artibeus jamaicensis]